MASMWTILRHLNVEIEKDIQGITPNSQKSHKFKARPRSEEVSDFNTNVRTNRMFQIDAPAILDAPGVEKFIGTRDRNPSIVLPIRFCYENTDTWTHALMDDFEMLQNWFLNNSSKVAGVQIRTIEDPVEVEKRPDDGVLVATMRVVAVLAVRT